MNVPSPVILDENGMLLSIEGERRVKNVMINGEPIDPEKTYTLASHNYLIVEGGDGKNMFMDDTLLLDSVMLDNQVLITYITETLGGVIGEQYADPTGEGRITIIQAE
jgi:2',3'-cyclic-nucleotide 2'-phosphodiesterase (5'-nucleotidase family)